jgi:hypothetical protein
LKLIFVPALIKRPESRRKDVAVLAERVLAEKRPTDLPPDPRQIRREVVDTLKLSDRGLLSIGHHVHVFGEPGSTSTSTMLSGPSLARTYGLSW